MEFQIISPSHINFGKLVFWKSFYLHLCARISAT